MKLPSHLAELSPTGLQLNQPVAQFEIGKYKNFVYLILDWETRKSAWIDPQEDLSTPLSCLENNQFELTSILLTHSHFDHIAGLPELTKRFPNIPVHVHPKDLYRIPSHAVSKHQISLNEDGKIIQVGNHSLEVIHTPGHSTGGCCYLLKTSPPYLFTGDTVFIRDCGRTDLESGDNTQMFDSLQRIKTLPPEAIILPGHHYQPETSSFLSTQLKESPPFLCKTKEDLALLP